jgi:AcrR family transcriptional regulator
MDDIAGELGVFKPTLYKFFKSKKKLFEACVDQAVEIWLEAAERALAHDGTAAERLGIYLKRNFEFCATDFGKAIMRLDLKEISPTAEQHMRDMRTRIDLIFREIIGDGVNAGEIAAGFEPKLVSFALFGSFNFVAQWYKPDGEFSADEILDQYFRMFFSGLSPRA